MDRNYTPDIVILSHLMMRQLISSYKEGGEEEITENKQKRKNVEWNEVKQCLNLKQRGAV
eukprot:1002367-Ditylum_brightwellii.AAC.1